MSEDTSTFITGSTGSAAVERFNTPLLLYLPSHLSEDNVSESETTYVSVQRVLKVVMLMPSSLASSCETPQRRLVSLSIPMTTTGRPSTSSKVTLLNQMSITKNEVAQLCECEGGEEEWSHLLRIGCGNCGSNWDEIHWTSA